MANCACILRSGRCSGIRSRERGDGKVTGQLTRLWACPERPQCTNAKCISCSTGHPLRRMLCHWPGNVLFLTSNALNFLYLVCWLLVYLVQDDLSMSITHFFGRTFFKKNILYSFMNNVFWIINNLYFIIYGLIV